MKNNRGLTALIIIFVIVSVIFIGLGFHKLYVYESPEYSFSNAVNAYVGGDAYNYIINAGYAIAFFILATFFGLCATGLGIIKTIKRLCMQTQSKTI